MMPFNPSFRRLLSRFIPRLSKKDVEKYENAVAVMHQLLIERNLEPKSTKSGGPNPKWTQLNSDLIEARSRAGDILQPHRARFFAIQKRYVAQRRLGFSQGKFQQLPSSPGKVGQVARAQGALLAAQIGFIKTFGLALVAENVSAKAVATAAVVVLLGFGINAFNETIGIRQSLTVKLKPSPAPTTFTEEGLVRQAQLSTGIEVTFADTSVQWSDSNTVEAHIRIGPTTSVLETARSLFDSKTIAFLTMKIPHSRKLSKVALRQPVSAGGNFPFFFAVDTVSVAVATKEKGPVYCLSASILISTDSQSAPPALAANVDTRVVKTDIDPSTGVATVALKMTVTTAPSGLSVK